MKRTGRFGDSRGFSLMQMVVTAAIVSVLMTVAVLGLRSARAAMRLNNSARVFAQNVERARLDAIRRHDQTNIEFINTTTYEISMDFAGNGDRQTRQFTLDGGVTLVDANGNPLVDANGILLTDNLPYADFDWRGRTSLCSMSFPMKNTQGDLLRVQVAGSGDITVNSSVGSVPTVTHTTVSATSDIAPNTTITGTETRLNVSPCDATTTTPGGTTPTTTPTVPPPVAVCSTGGLSLNTGLITIRRNGASTDTAVVTVTSPGTITPTVPSNLTVTASSSQNVTATNGGSVTYTVRSNNKTRGTFAVKFNFSNCTPVTLNVKVVN